MRPRKMTGGCFMSEQPQETPTYTQRMLRAAQEHAFSQGLIRMSASELRRFRGRRNWDWLATSPMAEDASAT